MLLSLLRRGPFFLALAWVVCLIVAFAVGSNGPAVLDHHGAGQVVNFTNVDLANLTATENGTVITFHLHPVMYKQFFILKLRMMHPGYVEGYGGDAEKKQEFEYVQRWRIASVQSDSGSVAWNHAGFDLESAKVHNTRMRCHPGVKWCDSHMLYNMDHVRDTGYFFKLFIHHAPKDQVDPTYYASHTPPFDVTTVTMNPAYTSFELGFKAFFFVVTSLVGFAPSG